ncbi:MAG TPA: urate hydroxylase PuuD [Gaiellaceae bacterium]|nr:urate hydroxylase PuuD [Gaiellaceae bacterium]
MRPLAWCSRPRNSAASPGGTLTLDPYVTDWLDLLARWLHVIAGIVWIGSSFYFIALDNHLRPPQDEREREAGIGGETWEIHGGGFYNIKKYLVAPRILPETLHWFKWEAYTTWLSGFALMIVLYYLNADTYLIDKSVADLTAGEAVAISVGLLAAGWLVYDVLCRLLGSRPFLLAAVLLGAITLAAWGVSHLFSARATYLQIGAMIGTMMVGNVFFVIIPAHWELVRAKQAGREPDPAANARGKLRSVHNNYLTLPVVFTMLSNHFPFTYGHSYSWLILVVLLVIGAWVRHFFNLRHLGRTVWAIPISAAVAIAVLAILIRPQNESAAGTPAVPFARVARIVDQRCTACHSQQPTKVSTAPRGIKFDTPQEIKAQASAIEQQAVQTKAMPLGNVTGMTQAERDLLGRWIAQGARIP